MHAPGLTSAQAAERLQRAGANLIGDREGLGPLRQLLRQFESPLVLILVFGSVVSLATGNWLEAGLILSIVVASALLGFSQEYRAQRAVARLRGRLTLTARVLRDGAVATLPVDAIVPGDVVMLAAGNLVPADGIILEARDFLVSEASLTGESFPVEKEAGQSALMGTSVRSGTATVEVRATGPRTAYGAIAARLRQPQAATDFARGVRQFGYLLMRVMLATVVFVLVVNQWLGRPMLESMLFAVALAVGLAPELLPAIVSVTLARGARRMAAQGVLVRRLEAIENLGTMDILCSDKTGTLTEATMALVEAADAAGAPSDAVRRLAFLNAAFETGIDNPIDRALVAAGAAAGLSTAGLRKVDEIPYDFLRRRLTIVVEDEARPGEHLLVTKGAVANVLAACAIAPAAAAAAEDYSRRRSAEGLRVIAVATRAFPAKPRYGHADESGMTLAGFALFADPVKAGAAGAIAGLAKLGIRTVVITGDNRHVAAHVARAAGLDAAHMITGADLARMRDEALWLRVGSTQVFAEIDPQQKERVVRALRRGGHTVGFLGDGINDAPALHAADVGISVQGAVDVARESADVVLLRPDLDVLCDGVRHGRRTFANTLKYIHITASANFGNMASMAIATPFMPFLPLAAKQILLNNFLSDLPMAAISTDHVEEETVAVPQRWDTAGTRDFMLVFGLVSTVFDLLTFVVLLRVFAMEEAAFQTAWFVMSLLTELVVVLSLRTWLPAWRGTPSRLLVAATLAVSALALCTPYLGAAAGAFGLVPLPARALVTLLAILAAYVLATELVKGAMRRRMLTRVNPGRGRPATMGA